MRHIKYMTLDQFNDALAERKVTAIEAEAFCSEWNRNRIASRAYFDADAWVVRLIPLY